MQSKSYKKEELKPKVNHPWSQKLNNSVSLKNIYIFKRNVLFIQHFLQHIFFFLTSLAHLSLSYINIVRIKFIFLVNYTQQNLHVFL